MEVVARDHHNQPVNDLTQTDFELFEGTRKAAATEKPLSGFRRIDPDSEQANPQGSLQTVLLPLGGRCDIRSTIHYELAFHPTKWTGGYHVITVATKRRGINLSYRSQYYVALSDTGTHGYPQTVENLNGILLGAACYHGNVPASLSLSATEIQSHSTAELSYGVTILPASLETAGIQRAASHVQLDYGVCSFSQSGRVLGYWHFSEDLPLDSITADRVSTWLVGID